jgi:hypothetical protein
MTKNKPKRIQWTPELIAAEAKKYKTRVTFMRGSGGAYNSARRINILAEVCAHMALLQVNWTNEMLLNEAQKYGNRKAFQFGSSGAYSTAHKRGIIDAVCAHMKRPKKWTKSDIPGVNIRPGLYQAASNEDGGINL